MAGGRSLPVYSTGTVTVAEVGGVWTVAGSATNFIAPDGVANFTLLAGDLFICSGGFGTIASVVSASSLTLDFWFGPAVSAGAAYKIYRYEGLPSQGVVALINLLLTLFSDSNPAPSMTIDTGAVKAKFDDDGAGNLRLRLRASAAAGGDGAYVPAIKVAPATGAVSFPAGVPATGEWSRNRFVNGGFDIWQEATSFTLAGGSARYSADQWVVNNGSGVSLTVSRVAAPSGFSGQYALNMAANGVAAASTLVLYQRFEAQALLGLDAQDCALSFDLLATTSAGALTGYLQFARNSTVDDGSFATWLTAVPFTVPAGSSRIKVAVPAAATAGLKYGAQAWIAFAQGGATGNVSISFGGAQLEKGQIANPFCAKAINQEWADCERFYQIVGAGASGRAASATSARFAVAYRTRMRAAPTPTLFVQPAVNEWGVGQQTASGSVLSTGSVKTTGVGNITLTGFTGMTSPNMLGLTNDCIALNARL